MGIKTWLYIITEGKASNYATIYKNIIFDILTRKYFFAKIIDMTIES